MAPDNDESLETIAPDYQPEDERPTLKQGADSGSKAARKVDLDLDDAPFLVDEEEPEEAPPAETNEPAKAPVSEAAPKKALDLKAKLRDKRFIAAAAALVLLAILVPFLLRKNPPPAEEAPPQPQMPQSEKPLAEIKPEQPKEPPKPDAIALVIEPFLVEHLGKDGVMRFLTFRFSASTENADLAKEFQRKIVVVRDASYYYLRNKSIEFLTDSKNLETLKRDLLTVMNQYLANGQIETILIEEYLIK